jgi:Carboxypeptidase regulatory-like domain
MSKCQLMRVLLSLLFANACFAQNEATEIKYQNSDPPNCGSFHTRKIQGTVIDVSGAPLRNVQVQVFDDVTRKPLWKTVTDDTGRFSISQRLSGRLRIVFFSPGFLTANWAITLTEWPDGGFFHSKAIPAVLQLPVGDTIPMCNPAYSR